MTNHIKKCCELKKDLNLTCVEEGKYKGVNTLIITGTYSPKLTACKYCQSHANDADEKKTIVKMGKRSDNSFGIISKYSNYFKAKNNDIFVKLPSTLDNSMFYR